MSKQRIDEMIPLACRAIDKCGLAKDGKINKTFCGQISTFGAAVTMGSLLSAVAFFSEDGGSTTERSLLMKAIYCILKKDTTDCNGKSLFNMLNGSENPEKYRDEIIDAAIAIKLAMNFYVLDESNKKTEDK